MEVRLHSRMLPSLFRRCTSFPSQQLVNLAAFHSQRLPYAFQDPRIDVFNAVGGSSRRGVRAFSRKRNIFYDPAERNEELTTLSEIYGSSRFNDEDEFELEEAVTTTSVPSGAAVDDDDDEKTLVANSNANDDDNEDPSLPRKLPQARNVRVKTADFIKSSVTVSQCPPAIFPEFAVIGRSNVGKSSLINLMTGRNSLAMVSKTPGKTRCINHFLINKSWYLVDLPGYGYAKTSKENVVGWNKFTREYFLERSTLVSVLLLVDASIPPMEIDVECANWLGNAEVPYSLIYTKVDKRKKGVPPAEENIAAFEAKLSERWEQLPSAIATSSRSGAGRNEVLAHIARLRSLYNTNQL